MHLRWVFVAAAVLSAGGVQSDEGMWLFNNLPKKTLQEKYRFEPSEEWVRHVMQASVRFNTGGSGSIVSSNGLVITNHHVASDTLDKLSSKDRNYVETGFWAPTRAREIKAHDLEVDQLMSIEDVTERVNSAVTPQMSDEEAVLARRAIIATIEKESLEKTKLKSEVVTLYQGGLYHLYRYKQYTDVRLVFAPEEDIAFFGGDPDNFEYPRYDLDIAFFRLYEDNKPVVTSKYLKWSKSGPAENELVFVSGNPGETNRMFTVANLEFLRDMELPYLLNRAYRRENLYQQYSAQGVEEARQAHDPLRSVENVRKTWRGALLGLEDPAIIAAKAREEEALIARVKSDPELQSYQTAWSEIEESLARQRELFLAYGLLEGGQAFTSDHFRIARDLVRMAAEDQKPNEERLEEYQDSERESLELELFSEAPIYPGLEAFKMVDSLSFLIEKIGDQKSLVQDIMAGKGPISRASELVRGTRVADVAFRREIANGGVSAIEATQDPMIQLALRVDGPSRHVRKDYEEKVEEPQRQAYAKIAKVLFKIEGSSRYPDATFTPRLSFGKATGYMENGKAIRFFTTIGETFDHADHHGNQKPFALPKSWLAKKSFRKLQTPFNFTTTADITGGSSGSPVLNRNGEFVGVIFDGNAYSHTSDFQYTEEQSRSIAVHSAAILETLQKIYNAGPLVAELISVPTQ